ncbi:hypothetical protein I5H03_gp055 [Mycobacterium phage Nibb]|uniref:Uncharacterized protein n=1 Tax=Mycobacterium phage Nibb TaxID=2510585 RepID=A0A411B5H9_9CAUD|nr:hypothetical protein I5H03_gp055 [Mycobacterium phage Nibb]QAX95591.1 hypothetical protein SEA_NIBB_52 [Mycobacterium phage Nibb]
MSRSTEAAVLAARRARKREERSRIAANTGVLDMFRPRVGKTATTDEVCRLLRVDYGIVLRHVLNRHRDELIADGWDRAAGTFTRRSIIRLSLLLRASTSPRAARIAKAARAGSKVISFDHAPRSQHCANVLDRAFALAEQIRDDDPGEVWAALNRLDRHTLTAVTVALAAMVDVDSSGATRWLRTLAAGGGGAEGLQQLVPTRETSDGLPLSVLDQIEADDEADQDDESETA